MSINIPIRKQVLRLILAALTLVLPIVLPLGLLAKRSDEILLPSISSYLHTEIRMLLVLLLVLLGLVFILYGLAYRKGRIELFVSGLLVLFIAFFPQSQESIWTGLIPELAFVCLLALFGWLLRNTFNLPLGFPVLTKIGTLIWVIDGLLLIWVLFFQDLWAPMVFVLEVIILWLFTAGILVRHKINKKLGG